MENVNTILLVLVSAVAALVLFQAIILFAMFLVVRKSTATAKEYGEELRTHIVPVLDNSLELVHTTRALITRLEPKLEAAANDLVEITHTATAQAKKMQVSAEEITERVRRQAERVDSMTTSALNTVDRVGNFVTHAVNVPVRQFSGIMAAAKAVVDTLRAPGPPRHTAPPRTAAQPGAQAQAERSQAARA